MRANLMPRAVSFVTILGSISARFDTQTLDTPLSFDCARKAILLPSGETCSDAAQLHQLADRWIEAIYACKEVTRA